MRLLLLLLLVSCDDPMAEHFQNPEQAREYFNAMARAPEVCKSKVESSTQYDPKFQVSNTGMIAIGGDIIAVYRPRDGHIFYDESKVKGLSWDKFQELLNGEFEQAEVLSKRIHDCEVEYMSNYEKPVPIDPNFPGAPF